MENNENLVTEQVAENVEQTAEETPKMYTQEEVDAIIGKKLARRDARIRKEYDRKYGDLEDVLTAGMGEGSIEEKTEKLKRFYQSKGATIPSRTEYSAQDLEVLARAEADEIIRSGYEDVVEEVDRLAEIGAERMTAREKAVYRALAEHRQNAEKSAELARIGITEEVYGSKDFKDFQRKFAPDTPIKDIYDIWQKTQPKKQIKTMGSMKNSTSEDSTVKDFYTRDEALRFTQKDFDNNPALYKAVLASLPKW